MKKIYNLIFGVLAFSAVHAQYTITGTNNMPVVGDVESTWALDTTGLNPGTAGTNQIWNFTGIVTTTAPASNKTYTVPAAAPNASLYPAANFAANTNGGGDYEMSAHTSSNIVLYGSSSNTLTIVYQNPLTPVNFPFTYGTISSDTYSTSYTYSGTPVSETGTITTTGDGYGTLNTPGNSIPNVLRVKLQQTRIQNIGGVTTNTILVNTYVFIGSQSKFGLLSVTNVSVTSSTNPTLTSKSKSGDVSSVILTSVRNAEIQKQNFSIFPNPSSAKEVVLHYVLTGNENYSVTIMNAVGQKIREFSLGERAAGVYREKVDLSGMDAGTYFIRLNGKNQDGTQKLIIE